MLSQQLQIFNTFTYLNHINKMKVIPGVKPMRCTCGDDEEEKDTEPVKPPPGK